MNTKAALIVSLVFAGCATGFRRGSLPDPVSLQDQEGHPISGACVLIDEVVIHGLTMYYSPRERALRTSDQSGRAWIDLRRQTGEDTDRYLFLVDKPGFEPAEVSVPRAGYHGILVVDLKPTPQMPNNSPEATPGQRPDAKPSPNSGAPQR